MDKVLQSIEVQLFKHHPEIEGALQPGISDQALQDAEALLGRPVHPEMRELYRWHNGLAPGVEFLPGYEFYSLELAIQTNHYLAAEYEKVGMKIFMAHEAGWLILFPDAAGDGYYYDPTVDYAQGGVFFNFREDGYYMYFPSIKNLLVAITECYQQGAYQGLETIDFDLEQKILEKYGRPTPQ